MTFRRLRTQNNFSFPEINLKQEDKIILGIGVIFAIALLFFIGIANKVFLFFEEQNREWELSVKKDQETAPIQQSQPKKSHLQESFERTAKAFKENKKKRNAAFKAMEKNFKERVKKIEAEHDQWMKRIHQRFDKSWAEPWELLEKHAFKGELHPVVPSKEKKNDPHK